MLPHAPRQYALQARFVFPIEGVPLRDGVVTIDGDRIVGVGTAPSPRCNLYKLGNVALLPGLVNAHVHLDFSGLQAPLGTPGISFADWLEIVVRRRRDNSDTDTAELRQKDVVSGLKECLASGTTTLGNISRDAEPHAGDLRDIEATVFLELIGLTAERAATQSERLTQWLQQERGGWKRPVNKQVGISPHAPYTARREMIAAACAAAKKWRVPLAMHLAESREELELLDRQQGRLVDVLRQLDAWDPSAFLPGMRPLDYLKLLSEAGRSLIVHGNYLNAEERAWLASHSDSMAVVFCPRTHHYFGHEPYPLAELLAAGATVALGTDGRGSNPDLSLLAEMRHVAKTHPDVPLATILRLGTLSGARALGREDRVGSLRKSKDANLVAVRLPNQDVADPHALLLHTDTDVVFTMQHGRVVHPDGRRIEEFENVR